MGRHCGSLVVEVSGELHEGVEAEALVQVDAVDGQSGFLAH
jgi:hypothetical protein